MPKGWPEGGEGLCSCLRMWGKKLKRRDDSVMLVVLTYNFSIGGLLDPLGKGRCRRQSI